MIRDRNKEYDGYGAIYALCDPITQNFRYIGKTTTSLKRRLQEHLLPGNLKKQSYKNNWIKSLLTAQQKPTILLLAVGNDHDQLNFLEKETIFYWRVSGANLTNLTDGGDGWTKGKPIPGGAKVAIEAHKKPIIATHIKTHKKLKFDSIKEAARGIGTHEEQIIRVVKHKTLYSCKGYFLHYANDSDKKYILPYQKAVYRINPSTQRKTKFKCIYHLQKLGYDPSSITKCCKGIRQLHRGFRWAYVD